MVTWQAELQATPPANLSWTEMDQFTPLQLSLQLFRLILNLKCKLDLKESSPTKLIEMKMEQKQEEEEEGPTEVLAWSLMLQLAWFLDVSFKI